MKKTKFLFLSLASLVLSGCMFIPEIGCAHKDENKDHICDLCGETTKCFDGDSDHKCDVCGTIVSSHKDDDGDHYCDICNVKYTSCHDLNSDHYCDTCHDKLSDCVDDNSDHNCDVCGKKVSEHTDEIKDHYCDICGIKLTEHVDENKDHKCDICGFTTDHTDENKDHKCDICGTTTPHLDKNFDHKCDICGENCSSHVDHDNDHDCDVCGEQMSEHSDTNSDGFCDYCNEKLSNKTGTVTLDLYGINDLHGAVTTNIGLINLGTFIKSKTDQDNTLFIDSGDTWQGSVESNLNRGNLITDVFGYAKLSARTIGNHDFDWGIDALRANSQRNYEGYYIPTLGANIYDYDFDTKTKGTIQQNDFAKPYVIRNLSNGLKVGIIGVIGESQITSISTTFAKDIYFDDYVKTIKNVSDYLRVEKGCDIIVASEHDAYDTGENVLASVSPNSNRKYVDFVFNGHSHYNEQFTVNGVTFAQAGANGNAVGHATLTYNFGTKEVETTYESLSTSKVQSDVSLIGQDQTIKEIVNSYATVSDPIGSEVLSTKFKGTFNGKGELANLMCEAIYNEAVKQGYDIDFAYCNNARADFSGTTFTYKDCFASFPFDNTVYIIKGKGQNWVSEINNYNYVYNDGISSMNSTTTYTIAALDYLAYHSNEERYYDYFPNATEVGYLKKANGDVYTYRDILADYIKANPTKVFNSINYSSSINKFNKPKNNPDFSVPYVDVIEEEEETVNYGTEANPLSVTEALALGTKECKTNESHTSEIVYCKGVVKSISGKYTYIKDSTSSMLAYGLSKGSFSYNVGDTIYVKGYIKNYNSGTIEFATINNVSPTVYKVESSAPQGTVYSLNDSNFTASSTYDSNFKSFFASNIKYNAYNFSLKNLTGNNFVKLNAKATYNNISTVGGYISNITKFVNISKISITYSSSGTSKLFYGSDQSLEFSKSISSSSTTKTVEIEIGEQNISYFRLEAQSNVVSVADISVTASSLMNPSSSTIDIASKDRFDLSNYVVNNPSEGQSVTIPYKISNRHVIETKTFTYHSFDYLQANEYKIGNIYDYALVDPIDVSLYFTLFNKIPPNYCQYTCKTTEPICYSECGTQDEVKTLFPTDLVRCVSVYNTSTGYMQDIPFNVYSSSKPLYFEFDIKLASYKTNNRGSGRVVGLMNGLSVYSNHTNVCFYTDDHYATFMEYLNTGEFSDRFDTGDSNFYPTSYSYVAQNSFTSVQ